jgi:hemerythrin-like domain-containing protein
MKSDITATLVAEHRLILRMLAVLERQAAVTLEGTVRNYGFYREAVDFIRNYADRFHHAKEEDVLFVALVANGMPRENSPVDAMLREHDRGREYVRRLAEATEEALAGEPGLDAVIAANAVGYLEMLREHIAREDTILYPLAERVIPEAARAAITAGYEEAERRVPPGFSRRYEELVAQYEEMMAAAA